MIKIFTLLIVCGFIYSLTCQASAQGRDGEIRKPYSKSEKGIKASQQGERNEEQKNDEEVKYRSAVRYVIVYNDIFNSDERRLEVLLDKNSFNPSNLIKLFYLLKKRFPSPFRLEIVVHTSLATIETPEEREMLRDGSDSRFVNQYGKYKTASFTRFENGREAFIYTASLLPYKEQTVVLVNKKY